MRIEPVEQFAATTGRSARARGYGESVEALVEEYAPLVRRIAWQVFSRVSRTSELDDLIAALDPTLHVVEGGERIRRGHTNGPSRVALPEGYLDHLDDLRDRRQLAIDERDGFEGHRFSGG